MKIKTMKFFWKTHKWTGVSLALIFAMLSVTGFLLLIKKNYDWIQPSTMTGAAGEPDQFITVRELFDVVLAQGHPDFQSFDDIDRIDFRPGKRVHKVRSKHHHAEIQVDAVSGKVLSVDVRRSDLIEQIHDGSFFAEWVHGWVMPIVAVALLFLAFSGLWLWIEPKIRRRIRRRHRHPMLRARESQRNSSDPRHSSR